MIGCRRMEQRTLGDTGLRATVLGYGAMELRDPQQVSDRQAEHLLGAVLDGGINFVDTSPDYGVSEDRIGAYLSHRRSEYVLATKGGCNVDAHGRGGDPRHIWTREQLLANIEQSLQRLRTDHVDIWQLHNAPVEEVDGAALLEVMHEVQATGKVRHVSISSTRPDLETYLERRAFATYQIPLFRPAAGARNRYRRGRGCRRGRDYPRRRRQGRALQQAVGPLGVVGNLQARRIPRRRRVALQLPTAAHHHPPRDAYHHRGHQEPAAPRR